MTETVDAQVGFDSQYPLSAAQEADFQRDGQITLRELVSRDDLEPHRQSILAATRASRPRVATAEEGDVYAKAFSQYEHLWGRSAEVAKYTLSPRFADVAARLLGVPAVRLYHDQALIKEGGGGHTPWHQDMHYWPLDTDRAITMWMPLVDVTAEMGELVFALGSHHLGELGNLPISDRADRAMEGVIADKQLSLRTTGDMRAGDASFHAAWTLHSAKPNVTEHRREVMTVIWYADGARVTEPANAGQRKDLETWLPGCRPGDLARSDMNPLVSRGPA